MSGPKLKTTCDMVLLETGDLHYFWECSACSTLHKDSRKFEMSEACPACGLPIKRWFDGEDDVTDAGTNITLNGSLDFNGK